MSFFELVIRLFSLLAIVASAISDLKSKLDSGIMFLNRSEKQEGAGPKPIQNLVLEMGNKVKANDGVKTDPLDMAMETKHKVKETNVNIKCQKPYSSKHKITIASSVFLFWANAPLACPLPVPPMSHNALHMFHLTALPPLHLKYDMCSTRHWPNQLPPKYTFKKHTFK